MAEKNIKSRIAHKHDTEENWLKATNFVPLHGELIIYDTDDTYDYERLKIGDGDTNVNNLVSYGLVPQPSSGDEGKFLKAMNGLPVWTTVLNAEEASF